MKLTLEAMETLEAIDRHGSFAAAARSLHKVQSAVSYTISKLESDLGLQLFDRSGHRAAMTPVGKSILEEGRFLLARARGIESLAEKLGQAWEARLHVVIDGILPMKPIMRVLKRLADEDVPTQIQIRIEFLGGVQDRFERDRADMMLAKAYAPGNLLVAHRLPDVSVVLVAHRDHALAQATTSFGLAELHRYVELTVHDSSDSRRFEDTRIFGGPRVFYLSDFNTKREAILLGLGFGWVPRYMVKGELARGELVELAYEPGSAFTFEPYLVHPVARPLGPTGQRFFELLRDEWR